jgi:DNA-binding MarR family transcriptional regulator
MEDAMSGETAERGAGAASGRHADDDAIDRIMAQWRRERPDLDPAPMAVFGRLSRLTARARPAIDAVFARHGLNSWSFDVLATLRRAGAPFQLSPGDLLASCMVTSGTMTHRIDQLEKAGYVARHANRQDRRSVLIGLTAAGRDLVDRAVAEHLANEDRLLAALGAEERLALEAALKRFLIVLEAAGAAGDNGGASV